MSTKGKYAGFGENGCVICSQCTDNAAMIAASMEAVEGGTFGGETLYGSLRNGALPDLVPAEIQAKYLDYIRQMIDGAFTKQEKEQDGKALSGVR